MSPSLIQVLYFMILLASFWLVRKRGLYGLLLAHVFYLPWFGLALNLGLTVTIDRFFAAALVGGVAVTLGTRGFGGFGLFLVYAFLCTVLNSILLPDAARLFPAARGEWRWPFQLVIWSLMVLPGAAVAATQSVAVVRACLRMLVFSVSLLSALALVQFAIFHATGIDILPINVMEGASVEARMAAFESARGVVFRACALGGEPKHLAYSAAVALTVVAAEWAYGNVLSAGRRQLLVATGLICAALVVTFSTQGLLLAAVNLAVILAFSILRSGMSPRRFSTVLLLVAAGAAVIAWIPGLHEVLALRTVSRLRDTGGMEDWNTVVADWLLDNPEWAVMGVGLGNVHLHALHHIPEEFLFYMGGQVFVAKAGALRLLSETGIIGLTIFLAAFLRPVVVLLRGGVSATGLVAAIPVIALVVLADFTVSQDGPMYVFLFGGLCLAVAGEASRSPAGSVATPRETIA